MKRHDQLKNLPPHTFFDERDLKTLFEKVEGKEGVLVMDHFFSKDEKGKCPDITKVGCNLVVEQEKGWKLLPHKDKVRGGGYVQLAVKGWKPKANLQVRTRNCVPHEEICTNIQYTLSKNLPLVVECAAHKERAIMCSGGPSLVGRLDEIRSMKGRVICVKHAHDTLIDQGIIPWGCILLDPRDHVQDFIETPHPEVNYFVASMVHATTIDRLIERNAKVWIYHALVGAGEQELIKQGFFIGGGSTAATRGMSVMHAVGFRRFACFGYDSCYYKKPDMDEKMDDGQPRFYTVEVQGRKFWSDGELVAQAQDFERLLRSPEGASYEIEVRGDGMIPHIFRNVRGNRKRFMDVFDGRIS